jgi:hypothetical protein
MMNYDSPAMLNMLSEGGAALGGVPMGGVNMDISLSQLGLPSASAMGRADEAERTRRLHNIIDTLKQKPGRISEGNVLALCTRLGIHFEKEGNGYILAVGESNLLEVSMLPLVAQGCSDTNARRSAFAATRWRRSTSKEALTCTTTRLASARQARRSSLATYNLCQARAG